MYVGLPYMTQHNQNDDKGFKGEFLDDKGDFLKVDAAELIVANDRTVLSFIDETSFGYKFGIKRSFKHI